MKKKWFYISLFIFSIHCPYFFAYDGPVHMVLNRNAVYSSHIQNTLIKQLGMHEGLITKLDGFDECFLDDIKKDKVDEIWEWIAFGGKAEDYGFNGEGDFKSTRAYNHFHNPIQGWDVAGLDTAAFEALYNLYYSRDPVSAVLWSLKPGTQDFNENRTGDWSWGKAKESYYTYLTGKNINGDVIASTESERNAHFADCFRALGQTIHLLEDMSVPLHTRKDNHPLPYGVFKNIKALWNYETYTLKNIRTLDNYAVSDADKPDKSLLFINQSPDPGFTNISPIFSLFDSNKYDGYIPFHDASIGLSEYSNANFLTDDTMFIPEYPYPKMDDIELYKDAENNRSYIKIKSTSNGEKVNHLAAVSWLYFWRIRYFPQQNAYLPVVLDTVCHEEYASLLIPRAVGYSAALLDYFFRGSIDINIPDDGFYAIKNNDTTGFKSIKLMAKNTTDNKEEMDNGIIELVVKYKISQQDPFKKYPVGSFPLTSEQFIYKVFAEKNGVTEIPRNNPIELLFESNDEIIPLWATDVYVQVVYRGQIGNEADGIAVGFKDISEPIPVDIFNNMDRICLDGAWFDAGTQEAINYVDSFDRRGNGNGIADEWDVYTHDLANIYYRFFPVGSNVIWASSTDYQYKLENLNAGEFSRSLYILTDYQYSYSYIASVNSHANDPFTHHYDVQGAWTMTSVKNQIESDNRYTPPFYTFRGVDMWEGIKIINEPFITYPDPNNPVQCPLEQ